jgi:hypothetical protein
MYLAPADVRVLAGRARGRRPVPDGDDVGGRRSRPAPRPRHAARLRADRAERPVGRSRRSAWPRVGRNLFLLARRDTCTLQNSRLAQLQADFAAAPDVRLVSISVDAEHDTPSVLRRYAAGFGADPERWLFLTGDPAGIARLAQESFRVSVLLASRSTPGGPAPVLGPLGSSPAASPAALCLAPWSSRQPAGGDLRPKRRSGCGTYETSAAPLASRSSTNNGADPRRRQEAVYSMVASGPSTRPSRV